MLPGFQPELCKLIYHVCVGAISPAMQGCGKAQVPLNDCEVIGSETVTPLVQMTLVPKTVKMFSPVWLLKVWKMGSIPLTARRYGGLRDTVAAWTTVQDNSVGQQCRTTVQNNSVGQFPSDFLYQTRQDASYSRTTWVKHKFETVTSIEHNT